MRRSFNNQSSSLPVSAFVLGRSRLDAGNLAQVLKPNIRARTSSEEHRIVRNWIPRHDALDVSMNNPVHRSIERLSGLDATIEQPTPARGLFHFAVGRLPIPGDMAPENRLVGRCRFPDRSGINPVVEEDHEGAPPISADGDWMVPAARSFHLVSCEVVGIDLRLGQIVTARHVALFPGLGEPRQCSIISCSHAQEMTARSSSQALFAVRPGLIPSSVTARS